jgi:hypothetical protein
VKSALMVEYAPSLMEARIALFALMPHEKVDPIREFFWRSRFRTRLTVVCPPLGK